MNFGHIELERNKNDCFDGDGHHEEHQEPNCHYQSKNNEPWLDIDI